MLNFKQQLFLLALLVCLSELAVKVECTKQQQLSHELTLKDLYILEKLFKTYIKIKLDEVELENGRYNNSDDLDFDSDKMDEEQIKVEPRNLKRPSLLDRLRNKIDGDLELLNGKDGWD